ncbi:MAG: ACT domain-containing protein [Erysipelotrichaceae bacterium]|nr:ACT domain-containing protein [Erysipelotrichaceae bacterium]
MKSDYLIVHKDLLPPNLEQVMEAKKLLLSHEASTISEAVKKVGISRNTYYKYRDYVYEEKDSSIRHAVISMVLNDEKGALSSVINTISKNEANILTISQAVPIGGYANVLITLDISNITSDIKKLLEELELLPATKSVSLDAIE